ncbi:MAG: helix-turn-helix domain-containing protein [Clostridia bacterium]|jgi:transcriptional regulator with XRE-family HTH domain|nr:helix-turn-helix domain-containing protein [Clostridia bacterium]
MDHYVTGATIRTLREKYRMTQAELAERLCVSDKAVSKWETGRGFPDVSLLEPLGKALHVSVPELLCGQTVVNKNRAANMLKSLFYICPVCGNVLFARGDALISCCGIQLPALEAEEPDNAHRVNVQRVEDEIYVSSDHSMGKDHYLSFVVYMTPDRCETIVLYPEGNAEARFFYRGTGWLYYYCNQHGLFRQKVSRAKC